MAGPGKIENLKSWKPGTSGNPAGAKPGRPHISTHIQNLLNDETFTVENFLFNGKQFKGAPLKAIIIVAMQQAMQGDTKWAEWLAKYGYGQKLEIEHSGEIASGQIDPKLAEDYQKYLSDRTQQNSVTEQ